MDCITGERAVIDISEYASVGSLFVQAADELSYEVGDVEVGLPSPSSPSPTFLEYSSCTQATLDGSLEEYGIGSFSEILVSPSASRVVETLLAGKTTLGMLPPWARSSHRCIAAAVQRSAEALSELTIEEKRCGPLMAEIVASHHELWEKVETELKDDKEFVKMVVERSGYFFGRVPEKFRDDLDIATEAVRNVPSELRNASKRLRGVPSLVALAIKSDGSCLKYGYVDAEGCRASMRDIVFDAVTKCPPAIAHAGIFKGDEEVVLKAVEQQGDLLVHAASHLRSDKGLVMKAVMRNGASLFYASDDLKCNKPFITDVVAKKGYVLQHAAEAMKADRDVVVAAMSSCPFAYLHAVEALKEEFTPPHARNVPKSKAAKHGFSQMMFGKR